MEQVGTEQDADSKTITELLGWRDCGVQWAALGCDFADMGEGVGVGILHTPSLNMVTSSGTIYIYTASPSNSAWAFQTCNMW